MVSTYTVCQIEEQISFIGFSLPKYDDMTVQTAYLIPTIKKCSEHLAIPIYSQQYCKSRFWQMETDMCKSGEPKLYTPRGGMPNS